MHADALAEVYLQSRAALVRYFAARLASSAAAEDIVQEIYLRIPRGEDAADIRDARAWLFRVGANLVIDAQRRAGRARGREHAWAEPPMHAGGEPVAPEPSAEAVVEGRQRLLRMLALVEAMPPRMAQAFRLHKFDGLTQAETARRMGVSVKVVERHLAHALQRLVDAIDGSPGRGEGGVDDVGVV